MNLRLFLIVGFFGVFSLLPTSSWGEETIMGLPITVQLAPKSMPVEEVLNGEMLFTAKRVIIPLKGKVYTVSPKDDPARLMEGQANLQTGMHRIMLAPGAEILARSTSRIPEFWDAGESPFMEMVSIAGRFYRVSVSKDNYTVKLQQVKPAEMGVLEKIQGMDLMVYSDRGLFTLSSNAPKWELPVGQYKTPLFRLTRGMLVLNGWYTSKTKLALFDIQSDAPTKIEAGEPLTMRYRVDVKQDGDNRVARIGITPVGQAGEAYWTGMQNKNGNREPLPKFTILSEDGRRLGEGQFEYG